MRFLLLLFDWFDPPCAFGFVGAKRIPLLGEWVNPERERPSFLAGVALNSEFRLGSSGPCFWIFQHKRIPLLGEWVNPERERPVPVVPARLSVFDLIAAHIESWQSFFGMTFRG